LEYTNTIVTNGGKTKLGFSYKDVGVFLLLLFLNLKFAAITIIQHRSSVIDLIVYILLIVTFNYSNWTYKSLLKTGFITIIYTLINFSSYKLNVLMPLLIIQSVSGIRLKNYLIINFIITGATLLIMYILFGEGVNMEGFTFLMDRKTRMSFGFGHPNTVALYYYCFIINGLLLLYYSKYKKHIPLYFILIIPLWYYIYHKTASRSFILSIIILYCSYIYFYIGSLINKKNRFIITSYIFLSLSTILTVITVFLSLFKDHFTRLDLILSKRLTSYNAFLHKINSIDFIFGSNAYKYYVVDSSYLHLLFEGGIIFFIGFTFFYIFSTVKMINKKEWIPICIIFSFMFYGLMETLLLFNMLIGTNIYWILLYYYYRNGKMKL
jgi:hypothetical protein